MLESIDRLFRRSISTNYFVTRLLPKELYDPLIPDGQIGRTIDTVVRGVDEQVLWNRLVPSNILLKSALNTQRIQHNEH